jgi:hypothetical protein
LPPPATYTVAPAAGKPKIERKTEPVAPPPKPEAMPREPGTRESGIKKGTIAGAGLDIIGAGGLIYGLTKESAVRSEVDKELYVDAEASAKSRNIAYTLGSIILLTGISVHIFF